MKIYGDEDSMQCKTYVQEPGIICGDPSVIIRNNFNQ